MEEDNSEEMSAEDLAEFNDMRIDTLIELLKEKGIFTEEEFEKKFDFLYPDEEE